MPWIPAALLAPPSLPRKELEQVERVLKLKKTFSRYYADENFPTRATELLRSRDYDVETAREARRLGHDDEDQAAYALREGRVLLTCDRDFMNGRKFPLHKCPALVVFDFGRGTLTEMRLAFRCLSLVHRAPEFYDYWAKLDATPTEWTEHLRCLNGETSRTRYRYNNRRLETWLTDEELREAAPLRAPPPARARPRKRRGSR
jgi:predicted nuclease of predicted toxin-antitoxin system